MRKLKRKNQKRNEYKIAINYAIKTIDEITNHFETRRIKLIEHQVESGYIIRCGLSRLERGEA